VAAARNAAAAPSATEPKVDRGELEAILRKQTWLVVGTLATIFVGTIIPIIGLWLK
jgi:hypothetical protein